MKKLLVIVLAVMLLLSAAMAEPLMGGWTPADDFAVTPEAKEIFDKGLEGLLGMNYTPLALMGTQVVAGTNYCFLARGVEVYPNAQPAYYLIYLYKDLEGNVKILNIAALDYASFCTYGE